MKRLSIPIITFALAVAVSAQEPVTVKFHEPKSAVTEATVPIDPTVRVTIQYGGNMAFGLQSEGIRFTFSTASIRTMFRIDNQIVYPKAGEPRPILPKKPVDKKAKGFMSTFTHAGLLITHTIEPTPTRPTKPGDLRRLDSVLSRYLIENKGTTPHTIGTRVRIDTHCNNDGALFNAPTFPKKVLDGIELREKTLPPWVQIMQQPNLEAPGQTGHFTLKFGSRLLGPDRFLCTAHSAGENGWEVQVNQAQGDSDAVMYWNDRVVPPGGKLEFAYAYGKGIAVTPESEGRVSLAFGGSFEPNKRFTITAYVDDPISNQSLALELPAGMELVEGQQMQPVPQPPDGSATSFVLWKCRVKTLGEHALTIRSSNGIVQTRTITIARP